MRPRRDLPWVSPFSSLPEVAITANNAAGQLPAAPLPGGHLDGSVGQLSLIQRVSPASSTSLAARAKIMAAASASGTTKSTPLTPKKVYSASSDVRLLPSMNG